MYGNKKDWCPHLNATGVRASLIGTGAVEGKHLAAQAVSNAKIATQTISLGTATDGAAWGKLNAMVCTISFATCGVPVTVTHGLGRIPVGWNPLTVNKGGVVFVTGALGTTTIDFSHAIATGMTAKVAIW